MSIGNIITLGFGAGGTPSQVITIGFAGAAAAVTPARIYNLQSAINYREHLRSYQAATAGLRATTAETVDLISATEVTANQRSMIGSNVNLRSEG